MHLPLFLITYESAVNKLNRQIPAGILFGIAFGCKLAEDLAGDYYVTGPWNERIISTRRFDLIFRSL